MSIKTMSISLGAGIATLAGMVLLLDSGCINGMSDYVSGIADTILGKTNVLYEPIRTAFLTCAVPAGVVSGLASLVLD